jgi:hypothetical protein
MQICKYKLENNIHIVYPVCNFQRASDNELHGKNMHWFIINKYKTFSMLIYSYINTNGNWENEKLCGKTRNCVETRRPKGGVFSHNFEFAQFPRVLIPEPTARSAVRGY